MRRNRNMIKAALGLAAAALMAVPSAAFAESDIGEFSLVKAQRPQSIHPGKLRLDLPLAFRNLPTIVVTPAGTKTENEIGVFFFGGAAFGVIENLEVGGTLLPVRFTPDADYLNPSIYGLYQILRGGFELGARATFRLPIESGTKFGIGIGLPFGFALNEAAYLGFEPNFNITLADPDPIFGFGLPVELTVNVNRPIFLHLRTGIGIPNLDVTDALFVNLGFGGGYTLGEGNDPMMDIFLNFDFPSFYNGALEDTDFDNWQLTLGVNWFIL